MNTKATSKWGTERVKREEIPTAIITVSCITDIAPEDFHPLGSVGKVSDSGDVDLAVDVSKYNIDDIHQKMMTFTDNQGVFNKGTKVGSYPIPISKKKKVQIDIMPSNNIELSKFLYYSAGDKSKYKGAVRTILLMSVASTINEEGIDYFVYDENGQLMIRAGRAIEMSRGLRRIFQYRPERKDKKGFVKRMVTISFEQFKDMFPDIEIQGGNIIIDDPQEIVEMLFGYRVKPSDVGTAEQVIDLIKSRYSPKRQQVIFERAIDRIEKAHFKVPEEIRNVSRGDNA